VKVLDGAAARSAEPALRADIVGGLLFSDDAHLVPDRFVRGLAAIAQRRGVVMQTSTEVLAFATSGSRVTGIETTRGPIPCDTVVLAAGAWSPVIARSLDLAIPIQAAKGYSVTYDRPRAGPRAPILLGEARVAVTPMGDMLRFAGTLELAGLDLTIAPRRVEAIKRAATHYLAIDEPLRLREVWRGLRPCTPDGLPLIGRTRRWENVVLATGHAMIGVSLGPITGKLVAQIVAGEKPMVDLAAVDPARYV
jgi:D-amino-acid dehydrogenase